MIWGNFVLAVWISIVSAGYDLTWLIRHARAVDAFYGTFTPNVVFFPILLGAAQLLLWFRVYREHDRTARLAAGFLAVFFTLQVVIKALQASVQIPIRGADVVLFSYLALSHALFALRTASAEA